MMTEEALLALALRLAGAKASIKKLPKILEQLSADDRLRNQYAFYKAHTGRWAGKGPQLQNMKAARTPQEKGWVLETITLLEKGEPVPSLDMLSCALRPLLTAPRGKKIVLADKKSIENRVLMWTAGCESGLQIYKDGRDPYVDFASRVENLDVSEVTSEMRQNYKPAVLGAGFGLGGGQLVRKARCCGEMWNVPVMGPADALEAICPKCQSRVVLSLPVKTGLWRYAEMMGIDLSQEQAHAQVDAFRETWADVANFWFYLEETFAACCLTKRNQTINSSLGCKLTMRYQDPALRIVLPSGRELVYPNAFAFKERTPRSGKKLVMGYETSRGNSWGVHNTYGGRLCENIVQAIAVDALMDDMRRTAEDPGLEIVGHTHDELICLADESDAEALPRLIGYMSVGDRWAEGLPMAADGYEGKRYAKG